MIGGWMSTSTSQFGRVLVAVALNELDADTLSYAGMVCRAARTQRIYCSHVAPKLDIPAEVHRQFPQLAGETGEDVAEARVMEVVAAHLQAPPGAEIRYEIGEGTPLVPLLTAARKHGVDLLIAGRNPQQTWGGTLSERLARKAPCSVLIVPRGSRPSLKRLLVPVDFSERSGDALDTAIALSRAAGGVTIGCLHVYTVPSGYHRSGKTYEQFAAIMRGHAERDYQQFIAARDTSAVTLESHFILSDHPATAIQQAAELQNADLLVMGARGRTDSAAAMLGSVTERCLLAMRIPLLAVKRQGENMTLLRALLNL
jgi:nucleotide-binding universal stress UspA family protein